MKPSFRPEGVRTSTARCLLALGVLPLLFPACRQGRPIALEADTGGAPFSDAVKPNGPADVGQRYQGPTDGSSDTKPVDDGPGDGPLPGTWVTIPPTGTVPVTFSMGSPTTEPCRDNDEDQHQVTLTHKFEITAHEVTQGEFFHVMGYNPAKFLSCGSSCPVECVKREEAAAYCNALSAKAGLAKCYSSGPAYDGQAIYDCPGYRLPTEAEFEFAYRAGTTTALYNGGLAACTANDPNADEIGWHYGNSGSTTHPVGQKAANAWGLHDMAGNVWEWCHDSYEQHLGSSAATDPVGSAKGAVIRGGSWAFNAAYMRAASRFNDNGYAWQQYDHVGFRCVRTK
jgi:formylglycine-generating enzyme required for sulfatase activity